MKNIAYLPAGRDACALWRMFLPYLHTPNSKFILSHGRLPIEEFIEADVCVVQRLASKGNLAAINVMHATDKKVVYDLDDNMWQIPKYNPAKNVIEQMKDGFETCSEKSDVLTVSTDALKKAVQEFMPFSRKMRVEVVPNAVDFDYFPERTRPEGKFIVGWGGTATHSEDTAEVFRLLPELVSKYDKLNVELVCSLKPNIRHERIRLRGFAPVAEYPARLATWGWDVFLGPLEHNRFNASKSNIKILEAAAVGSPILVSDIKEYGDFMRLDPALHYLICHNAKDWKNKIIELMHEPELRKRLVKKMRKVVREHYDVRKVAKQWQAIYESL